MKAVHGSTSFIKPTAAAFALMLALHCLVFLGGCSAAVGLSFNVVEIDIFVGEERDLFPYAVFDPTTAADKRFALETSDGGVVETDGTVVRGVGKGTAAVAAIGRNAAIEVNVSYRAPRSLDIVTNGDKVYNAVDPDEIPSISFTAELDGDADPETEIEWVVDGETAGRGRTFTLSPTRFGAYEVCARADRLSASEKIKVYRPTDVFGEYSGELYQSGDFSPVVFTARERQDTRNPESMYEWRINGEFVSSSSVYSFTPSESGEYEITLTVNGVRRGFSDGKDAVTVTAEGKRAPVGTVVQDGGSVYIVWRDGGGITSVSVTDPDGTRTVYSRTDSENSYRFGNGKFDATGIIQPCSDEQGSYIIALVADGRGEDFEFRSYGAEARQFIENTVAVGNAFIADEERAADIIWEMYAFGKRSARAYLARGLSENDFISAAEDAAAELGVTVEAAFDNRIASLELSYVSNVPNGAPAEVVGTQMYAALPHIEYDAAKLRGVGYVLAADRAARSVETRNSEELLYAVAHGLRPEPSGAARTVYTRARNALINIIGADQGEFEKVHAIYDWLQFVTARVRGADGAPCNYIDGLFGDAASGGGNVRSGMSDRGLAKTFALMCGMEGIYCDIAIKPDGDLYNRVKIGGLYYNVDVYGGETSGAELGLTNRDAEFLSHGGLLVADDGADFLPQNRFDAYDRSKSYCMQKAVYRGVYFDRFIDVEEKTDRAQIKAAVYADLSAQGIESVSVYTPFGLSIFQNTTYGIELALDAGLTGSETAAIVGNAVKAVQEFAEDTFGAPFSAEIRTYVARGRLYVIVPIPISSVEQTSETKI